MTVLTFPLKRWELGHSDVWRYTTHSAYTQEALLNVFIAFMYVYLKKRKSKRKTVKWLFSPSEYNVFLSWDKKHFPRNPRNVVCHYGPFTVEQQQELHLYTNLGWIIHLAGGRDIFCTMREPFEDFGEPIVIRIDLNFPSSCIKVPVNQTWRCSLGVSSCGALTQGVFKG